MMGRKMPCEARNLISMTMPSGTADVHEPLPDSPVPGEQPAGVGRIGNPPTGRHPRRRFRYTLPGSWRVFQIAGPVLLLISYLLGQRWQGQIRDLMDADAEGLGSKLLLPVVAALVFVGLVAASRGIRRFFWWVAGWLNTWMGRRA